MSIDKRPFHAIIDQDEFNADESFISSELGDSFEEENDSVDYYQNEIKRLEKSFRINDPNCQDDFDLNLIDVSSQIFKEAKNKIGNG